MSEREYTKKQYRVAPISGSSSITQNQNAFFIEDDLSNPNRKYSIATIVTAVPITPANSSSLTVGRAPSGTLPAILSTASIKNNPNERVDAVR